MSSILNFGTGLGLAENVISFAFPSRRVRVGDPLLLKSSPLSSSVIEMDASLEELHTATVEVTSHPVENGADISDHIRRKPRSIRITGIVTNHPVTLFAFARTSISGTRAEQFFEALEKVMDAGTLISVFTTLRQYDNMVITEITVPRNAEKGNVVEATITFREIIIVNTETLAAVPVEASAGGLANAGKIAPPPAAAAATAAQSQSALSSFAGLF